MSGISSTVELIEDAKKHFKSHYKHKRMSFLVRLATIVLIITAAAFYFLAGTAPKASSNDGSKAHSIISRLLPR